MKARIVFVDDEQRVLSGLRRQLHSKRESWDLAFVDGGEAALAALASAPADVVCSDMRMPGMDGAQLLARVAEAHPATARLVLSGHADTDRVQEARAFAHRYLNKPCPPELLEASLCEMLAARARLASLGWTQAQSVWGLPPGRVPAAAPLFSLLGLDGDATRLQRELDARLDEQSALAESLSMLLGLSESCASGERLRREVEAGALAGLALGVRFAETFGLADALPRAARAAAACRAAGGDGAALALCATAALHDLPWPATAPAGDCRAVLGLVLSTWGCPEGASRLLGELHAPGGAPLPAALQAPFAALAGATSPSVGTPRQPIRNP